MRAPLALALVAVLLLAGCGGDGGGSQGPTTATGRSDRQAPGIDRQTAIAEARSAASQDSARQDYSLPPTAFAATCNAPGAAARSRAWKCAVRSVDRRCRGAIGLAVTVQGVVVKSRVQVRCTGDSRRG